MCQPYFIINKKFVNTNWEAKAPPYFIINKKFVDTNGGEQCATFPFFIKRGDVRSRIPFFL